MKDRPFSVLDVLRTNEGLLVAASLSAGVLFVLLLFVVILRRAGVSLRPIIFLAGLFAPVVGAFLLGQLALARVPAVQPDGGTDAPAVEEGRFTDRDKLFGPGVPPGLIREVKSELPGILDEAEAAEAGVTMSGETVLVARFAEAGAARRAAAAYHHAFGLSGTSGGEAEGWRARRMQGDFIEMLLADRCLFVWSGLTPEAAAERRAASVVPVAVLSGPLREPLFPALQPLARAFDQPAAQVAGLVVLAAVYAGWFFRGSSWAASVAPATGMPVLPESEVSARLLAFNDLNVPFTVSPGRSRGEFFVDWRYADAVWVDLARVRGMRRTFRVHLMLDGSSRTVRATDYTAACDWSAGVDGAGLAWKAFVGIMLFQQEQETVFGVQLDREGRPASALVYSYTFNLNEMKGPLAAVVARSGWTWRPTVIVGPSWMRWLTG